VIGVTICTYNRPDFCEKTVKAVRKHLTEVVDHVVVVNDGSIPKFNGGYRRVEKATQSIGGTYIGMDVNGGVAKAKNIGLQFLLDKGCTWLFTLEDDILIQSPRAVTEYVRVAKASGVRHLSFAHHGEANLGGPVATDGELEYYFHSIGAWCHYTADELTKRLLDERFRNAWEHVHHELTLGVEPYRYPDIAHSADYLKEIPGSIEKSSIRPLPDWQSNIRQGLIMWKDTDPDTFKSLFGDGTPLQQYAQSIIA